ncbi:uncharacterized protein K02A2.6-like [Eupeodes corollae]|uniref:uncharacterized protein K02A2.6-like n=1 Tax=Eupeodes corollae TaxID=290404 RepID=UPI002493B6C3|nr:uncharacterized protein K02A2.6-like [Eupeodes corollae]
MTQPVVVQSLQTPFSIEPYDKNIKWSRWVDRFETAIGLFDHPIEKKVKLLLHYMGSEAYNVLCDKVSPDKPSTKSYDDIIKTLSEFFDPTPNEILENYRFHLRKQQDEETCEEFLNALRRLSIGCKFGSYLQTALRNQFVFGLKNQRIQNRLLEKEQLTLSSALDTAKAIEVSEKGGAELHKEKELTSDVNFVKENNKKKKNTWENKSSTNPIRTSASTNFVCYRCNSTEHLATKCKYKNSMCSYCNTKGHLQRACFKMRRNGRGATNQLEEETGAENICVDEICHISDELLQIDDPSQVTLRSKMCCELIVNDIPFIFQIDTGSPVTVVGLSDAKKQFGKLHLQENDTELVSFCGKKLECFGYVNVKVKTKQNVVNLKMYIVRSQRNPLLGREWLRQIKLDWGQLFKKQLDTVMQIQQDKAKFSVIDELVNKYPKVFSKTAGKITGIQARLHMKENASPIFIKARRVAFPLIKAVEDELEKLVASDILEPVDTCEWATPIVAVRKRNNQVRICGDYKATVNKFLNIDEYPLPSIDELFTSMAGGKKFTKIDLSKAYLQLEIHPDDRDYLTLSTHKGLYRPKRMMFGIACAPAKWQRHMEQILSDIPGVKVFLDDIKITAENDSVHLQRLEEVLRRLNHYNMRVNLDKSEFMVDRIEYCGYMIDCNGIHKMRSKIDAIQNMKQPSNKDEVRAFVGLINYYGRFLKGLSTILYPINNLLKDKVFFYWDEDCEKSFQSVKKQMQSDVILAHYDPKLPLILATDASPYGVGAVLSHVYPDKSERPIQYASQTLSKVQQKYSQVDREAYAIIFGIKKFYQYVYARRFTLVTDNKPISQILSPHRGLPTLSATRMQHYAIFLESFDYDIRYRKSKENANADAMSRLPVAEKYNAIEEIDLLEVDAITKLPVTVDQLSKATERDEQVKTLIKALQFGRECDSKDRFGINQTEFAMQQGCLMRNIRVYVPKELRARVLAELHSSHFGMTKMKTLARGYCWWQNMDRDIEQMVMNCTDCQLTRPEANKIQPTHFWEMPGKPFERVHADFAGPFRDVLYIQLLGNLHQCSCLDIK